MLIEIAAGLFIFLVVLSFIGWAGIGILITTFLVLAVLGISILLAGSNQVAGFFLAIGLLGSIPFLVNRYLNTRRPALGS